MILKVPDCLLHRHSISHRDYACSRSQRTSGKGHSDSCSVSAIWAELLPHLKVDNIILPWTGLCLSCSQNWEAKRMEVGFQKCYSTVVKMEENLASWSSVISGLDPGGLITP